MADRYDALTVNDVRDALSYSPATGMFHWRIGGRGRRVGELAGGKNSQGYVQIQIRGRLYKAHRLAWLHHYGTWPTDDIDHINRVKADNRIVNLRDVPRSINNRNRPTLENNSSGYTGVSIDRRSGKWVATLRLGTFASPEDARDAYNKALAALGMEI